MTRMKESGIDWIGQIPEEWEVKDIKHIFEEIGSGATPKSDNETFYDGDINWIQSGDLYQTEEVIKVSKTITYQGFQSTSALKIYKHPFIALAMYGASVGNVAISCIDACVNQAVVVMLGTSEKVRFGKYAIEASKNNLIFSAQGGTQPNISQILIKNWNIPQPDSSEQTKIADFLDKKTAQLDKVKGLLEEQIQKLKDYRASLIYEIVTKGLDKTVPMKDSGIDWIGQIPEEWEVSKLEQYVDIFGRIGFRGYTTNDIVNEGEGAISYSPSNIIDYSVIDNNNTYISWSKYDESPEIQIKTGDVLYVKTGSSYGKAGIVNKLSNKATINPQLVVLKPKKNTDSRLINYFLNSSVGKDQSELIVGGSTIPTITQESIKKMIFPKMSFEEQQKIADFLDKKTIQIDKLIQIKNQQIENINKQRQTLIYDYVTGKRRV